jgi:D-glycerate 3-kinase
MSTAVRFYLPVLNHLLQLAADTSIPKIIGLNGSQGSGKTTLSKFLVEGLTAHHIRAECLSIDDFYLSSKKRKMLANKVHPLLETRGVPGTHDIKALTQVLKNIRGNIYPTCIPRFNKATDNPFPENYWTTLVEPLDLLIVEGWCWGAVHQTESELLNPVNELEEQEDAEGIWRRYVNNQLALHYEPLYEFMTLWVMLKAPSFSVVNQWREEQETKLRLKIRRSNENGAGVMTPAKINRFVQHYQRLTIGCLDSLPAKVDILFELDFFRNILKYQGIHLETGWNQGEI